MLSIGRTKLYELLREGRLPGVVYIGRCLRIKRSALEHWVDAQTGTADEMTPGSLPSGQRPA